MDERQATSVQLLVLFLLGYFKEQGLFAGDDPIDWSLAERGAQYIAQSCGIKLIKYPYEKPMGQYVYSPNPTSPAPGSASVLTPPADRYTQY